MRWRPFLVNFHHFDEKPHNSLITINIPVRELQTTSSSSNLKLWKTNGSYIIDSNNYRFLNNISPEYFNEIYFPVEPYKINLWSSFQSFKQQSNEGLNSRHIAIIVMEQTFTWIYAKSVNVRLQMSSKRGTHAFSRKKNTIIGYFMRDKTEKNWGNWGITCVKRVKMCIDP